MVGPLFPKFGVIDDFLGGATAEAIIEYAIALESQFRPLEIAANQPGGNPAGRSLAVCYDGLGPHSAAFEAAITGHFAGLCAAAGIKPFDLARIEVQLCAFMHGDRIELHIDTDRKDASKFAQSDRVLTGVYYLSSGQDRFEGGELALHPFHLDAPPELIMPRRNRLVVFPSFAGHEVLPVIGPRKFSDARLSINCWLHRRRNSPQPQ